MKSKLRDTSKWEKMRAKAHDRHEQAFVHLLEALRRYREPLPHLCEYMSKEARSTIPFLEVLLDQLYPRELWENELVKLSKEQPL